MRSGKVLLFDGGVVVEGGVVSCGQNWVHISFRNVGVNINNILFN